MQGPNKSRIARRQPSDSKQAVENTSTNCTVDVAFCQPPILPPLRPGLILHNGRPVASVEPDGVLLRWAKPSDLLRQPASFAFHPDVLDEARARGATLVRVILRDPPHAAVIYEAPLADFDSHGLVISRGYGRQVALTLDWWRIDGSPSRVEQRAEKVSSGRTSGGSGTPSQLSLFGAVGHE